MSPEQCTGKVLDHRSDIFSLGVVLYEWITGFKLFTGESEVAILKSITDGKIYPPSYFKADVPEAVEHILMKALEKDREKRYQTAWDMQYDLDQFLSQYEFTPSNIHLANFLKQLFSDELDEERRRLLARGTNQAASPACIRTPRTRWSSSTTSTSSPSRCAPAAARATITAPLRAAPAEALAGCLTVDLRAQDYEALKALADKNELAVGTLVGEIVAAYLKYK